MSDQPQYPDILGMLSTRRLVVADVLQAALGVFPTATALDKPVEALLLLQNMTNRPLPLALTVRLPLQDAHGELANFFTPRPRPALALPPGECGLLHIPITPQLPTRPGLGYTVEVQIRVQKPASCLQVRSPAGGPEPSLLALSPFRLTVLRGVNFGAEGGGDTLRAAFDVLPGRFPPGDELAPPRYEALWSVRDLGQEEAALAAVAGEAQRFARTLAPDLTFPLLLERTRALYDGAGLPLHPAEAHFIAKLLAYVLYNGLDLEEGFALATSAWFRRLCRLFATGSEATNNPDQLIPLLYTGAVYDAALLGLHMVRMETGADFGDADEQRDYAARLVAALEGREPLGLEHVYVPLVLAGVIVHARLIAPGEKLWRSLDQLREARNGRIKLAGSAFGEVFDLLNLLLERSEALLAQTKVPRK